MFINLQRRSEAIGLALLVCLNFIPDVARAAPEETHNVIYVDNVTGDDANPGTAAEPKATIQAGEDAAEELYGNEGVVVVRGGGPPYEGGAVVSSSMKFYGNAVGKHRGNLPRPVVIGWFFATDVPSLTVQGFEMIDGGGVIPFLLQNVGHAVITDNHVNNVSFHAVAIISWDATASSIHVEGNRFKTWNSPSVYVRSLNDSKMAVTLFNNSFSDIWNGSAYAVDLESQDGSGMSVRLEGNDMEQTGTGVSAISNHDSLLKLAATKNRISAVNNASFALQSTGDSRQEVQLIENEIQSGPNGAFYAVSGGDSTFDLHAASNIMRENESMGGAGAGVSSYERSQMNVVLEKNQLEGPFGVGSGDEGVMTFAAARNKIKGVDWFTVTGLGLYGYTNGAIHATLSENRIEDAGADGIVLQDNGTASVVVTEFDGNRIKGASGNGILVDLGNAANSVNGTKNNVVEGSGGNSVEVVTEPVNGQIKVNGKTISPLVDVP